MYIYAALKMSTEVHQIHYLLSAVIVIVQLLVFVPDVLQSSRNMLFWHSVLSLCNPIRLLYLLIMLLKSIL